MQTTNRKHQNGKRPKVMSNGYTPKKRNSEKQNEINNIAYGKTRVEMRDKGIDDPRKWSKCYKKHQKLEKIKKQNEDFFNSDYFCNKKSERVNKCRVPNNQTVSVINKVKGKKTKYKDNKLDLIAKNRSREEAYKVSNTISKGVLLLVKKTIKSEETLNFVRSGLTLLISEEINKILEKPLKTIDKIEMFYNLCNVVYKVIVKVRKTIDGYKFDYENLKARKSDFVAYEKFKKRHKKELDDYFDYSFSLEKLTSKNEEKPLIKENYIIIIIKHADKWVVTKKRNKYEFFCKQNDKTLDNNDAAKQILSHAINAIKFNLYKLGSQKIKEGSKLKEYSIFYANVDLFERDSFNANKIFYLCSIDNKKKFKPVHFNVFKIYEDEINYLEK